MSFGLPEEIVLLGLDDATGRCVSAYSQYAWSAAVLAELKLQNRLEIAGQRITTTGSGPTGDDVLDEALETLRQHPRKLTGAVRLSLAAHGRDRTLRRLVDSGILEYHDNRVLGIFHFRRYPAHDGKAETAIRDRLHGAVVYGVIPDERTRMLLSIAAGAGLLNTFVSRTEREESKVRLREIIEGEPIGAALRTVIEEDEASATTATIIAATT